MKPSLAFVFLGCVTPLSIAQSVGRISGSVLDDHGQIVEGASVCLSQSTGKSSTTIDCTIATEHGQFQIPKVAFGTYHVFAVKEAEGYSTENQGPGEPVVVSAANPSPDVTIHLQAAGAILVGTVQDKSSGKPIKGASIRYVDVDDNAGGASSSHAGGEFSVTVPSERDLVIVVSAKGYKGWVYTDPSGSSRPMLRLIAGERRQLDVELEPGAPPLDRH